ncbi:nucleotide pyrophosphohydrolase [Candidatus Woesearchaeota archaeon]|nr:nucleotide pyrophosphohydrolase [Candidatus Woesearchaeota archaeon]
MKEFDALVDALKQSRRKCPWARERITKEHLEALKDEVRELEEAVLSGEKDNVREELADVIWDALFIAIIEEEQGSFTIKEMFEKATEKLKRRKPWVFGTEKVKDSEEAVRRWNEIKAQEKANNISK